MVWSAGLRGKLPDSIALPASVTVPFGSFEEALGAPANADVRKRLQAAVDRIPPTAAEPALAECRSICMEVGSDAKPFITPVAEYRNSQAWEGRQAGFECWVQG